MGASNSRRRQSTLQSFRHKQVEVLTRHKQNLEQILKVIEEIDMLNVNDDICKKLNDDIQNVESELHRMKRFIKQNNKKKHEYLLKMCADLIKMLQNKTNGNRYRDAAISNLTINNNQKMEVNETPEKSVQTTVSEELDGSKLSNTVQLKLVQLKSKEQQFDNENDTQDNFTKLYNIRRNLEDVKPKIYLFGGTNKSFEYCVLLQEINNIRMDLLQLGELDAAHLKHEQKLALKEIEECLKLLDNKASFNEITPEINSNKVATTSTNATPEKINKVQFVDVNNMGNIQTDTTEDTQHDLSNSSDDDDYDIVYDSAEDLHTNKPVAVTSF